MFLHSLVIVAIHQISKYILRTLLSSLVNIDHTLLDNADLSLNTNLAFLGSSIKYVRSDFVVLDPSPGVPVHMLLSYTPSPLVPAYGYYFLKKI